jgi:hypothetical protein
LVVILFSCANLYACWNSGVNIFPFVTSDSAPPLIREESFCHSGCSSPPSSSGDTGRISFPVFSSETCSEVSAVFCSSFGVSGLVVHHQPPPHQLYHLFSVFIHLAYKIISQVVHDSIVVIGKVYQLSKNHHSNLYQFFDGIFKA